MDELAIYSEGKVGYLLNAARLKNACWRTWVKSKYNLKTMTSETLNWYVQPKT
jgi:Fungal protein of unknown function (DUF1752)